jgi:hypothetical protein
MRPRFARTRAPIRPARRRLGADRNQTPARVRCARRSVRRLRHRGARRRCGDAFGRGGLVAGQGKFVKDIAKLFGVGMVRTLRFAHPAH